MASGSAVRSDNPFKDIQVPVRGTVAVEMEGAAFGRAMASAPGLSWLVVKGVSDYADSDKDDSYHQYASTASALYLLCFIREYVSEERLPRVGVSSSSNRAGREDPPVSQAQHPVQSQRKLAHSDPFHPVWNVPHRYAAYFTGRDQVLEQLLQGFTSMHRSGMLAAQALTGLGGLGKTQTTVAYAYRYRKHYQTVLWVRAETEEDLLTHFKSAAELLERPEAHLRSHFFPGQELDTSSSLRAPKHLVGWRSAWTSRKWSNGLEHYCFCVELISSPAQPYWIRPIQMNGAWHVPSRRNWMDSHSPLIKRGPISKRPLAHYRSIYRATRPVGVRSFVREGGSTRTILPLSLLRGLSPLR